MHAHAAVTVERRDGRDRCVELRSVPPLTLRETPGQVHLVGSAAAPLGGDHLRLDIRVGPSATLHLRSVAAMLALPGRTAAPSELVVDAEVGEGATLLWDPQPTIAVAGCDHHGVSRVRLGVGAHVLWRDELVLGRAQERSGSLRQRLAVDVAGVPLLRTEVAVGERYPGAGGPAGTAGARAVGSLLVAGPRAVVIAGTTSRTTTIGDPTSCPPGPGAPSLAPSAGIRFELLELAGPGVLLTALAPNAGALQRALDQVVGVWASALGATVPPLDDPVLQASGAAR